MCLQNIQSASYLGFYLALLAPLFWLCNHSHLFLIFSILSKMARIRTISHRTRGDFSFARAIVHTPIALEMEQEGDASLSWIHLLCRDVPKFQHDGSIAGKIPKML
jgi:hypothetical protein